MVLKSEMKNNPPKILALVRDLKLFLFYDVVSFACKVFEIS